jgi:hypothetical protein
VGRGLLQRGTPHAKWQFLEAKHSTTGGPLVTNIRNPRLNGERGPAKIIFNSVSDHFQTLAKMIADKVWQRKFDDPFPCPAVASSPPARCPRTTSPSCRRDAVEALMLVAEYGGPTMFAGSM